MPNNAAWDTATTDPANRATQAVSLNVAGVADISGTPLVRFDFAAGDTLSSSSINDIGFAFSESRSIALSEKDVLGVEFVYGPDGPTEDSSKELGYTLGGEYSTTYERFKLDIPSNFTARIITELQAANTSDISEWEDGDFLEVSSGSAAGIFETSIGDFFYIRNGSSNGFSGIWRGETVTNLTKGTSAALTLEGGTEVYNNKFATQWQGTYSVESGISDIEYRARTDGTDTTTTQATVLNGNTTDHGTQGNTPSSGRSLPLFDAGQTNDYVIYRKKSTSLSANDAVTVIWKNGQVAYEHYGFKNFHSTLNFYERGYLMGWSNSGFKDVTKFYITLYEFYGTTRPGGLEE